MNLLVLSPWFPCPPDNGSRLRAFHLVRAWADEGHSIRLVTGMQDDIADRTDIEILQGLCESVAVFPWQWHDGGSPINLRHLFSTVPRSISGTDNPALRDAMIRELARMPDACVAMELAAAPFVPKNTGGVPVLLEQVEVSGVARAVREASGAKAKLQAVLTQAKHDRYWRRDLKRFDALTVVSEGEASAVRQLIGSAGPPVTVVPNGVDTSHYSPQDAKPVAGRLIYNGAMTYGPNRDAVLWFVRNILPRIAEKVAEAHLVVTGTVPKDGAGQLSEDSRVTLTGFVPDLRPVLASSVLCVVPLKTGGGTRLKILEAWAAGVPVVSTHIGANGIAGAQDGTHLVLADGVTEFTDACVHLLKEPKRRITVASNARRLAVERYDWQGIARRGTDLLESLRRV